MGWKVASRPPPPLFRFYDMRFKGDISGLEELDNLAGDINTDILIDIGQNAIKIAQEKRISSGLKVYQNMTGNLHNAPGACVVRDGKIVWMEVASDTAHPEAKINTERLLMQCDKSRDGLYLADGMEYASYVRAKGFDVLDSAILYADKRIEE